MCGIAGIYSTVHMPELQTQVNVMLQAQRHRGPDNLKANYYNNRVALGHNRLSIIDLSENANQPFRSSFERYSIVFNGEIYNYKELRESLSTDFVFRTQSDTEVLLSAYVKWGKDCLQYLNGMFAFAVYDLEEDKIFAARDRFGVKPFYYHDGEGIFLFASEIKALHAYGVTRTPNERMWASYLTKGVYSWEGNTFWRGIKELPAGHYIEVGPSAEPKTNSWYSFVDSIKKRRKDPEYNSRTFEQHLRVYESFLVDAVKLRFRSDVPVGFNVSGGVDSSTLLGVIHQLFPEKKVQAFTFYCNDERYDELPWVKMLMNQTGRAVHEILLQVDEVPELAEKMTIVQDEPYGGIPTLAYGKIFKVARELGCIVLLDGQGMDEAWAGYDYYHKESDSTVQGVKTSPFRPQVLKQAFKEKAYKIQYPEPFDDRMLNMQYRDLFYTKIPRALRFNDRLSMQYSTELREPFLDYRLVEYAFALPAEMKVKNSQPKWALRKLSERYLSGKITTAPKRPLQTPQREWLTENLLDWVEEQVIELQSCEWFEKDRLLQEWKSFKQSEKDNTFFLWQWIGLQLERSFWTY